MGVFFYFEMFMKMISFLRILLISSILFMSRPNECFILKTYCSISSLLGLYIFYKNPNKNFKTFARSLGKGFLVVPGYVAIGLENMALPAWGRGLGLFAAPVFGMEKFEYLVQSSHNVATKHMHQFVNFVFPY